MTTSENTTPRPEVELSAWLGDGTTERRIAMLGRRPGTELLDAIERAFISDVTTFIVKDGQRVAAIVPMEAMEILDQREEYLALYGGSHAG